MLIFFVYFSRRYASDVDGDLRYVAGAPLRYTTNNIVKDALLMAIAPCR